MQPLADPSSPHILRKQTVVENEDSSSFYRRDLLVNLPGSAAVRSRAVVRAGSSRRDIVQSIQSIGIRSLARSIMRSSIIHSGVLSRR